VVFAFLKESLPVSDNLDSYFANPCPVLSDNNAKALLQIIRDEPLDWIVEYGLGASTFYFLEEAQKKNLRYIAVENHYGWFRICIARLEKAFKFEDAELSVRPWSMNQIMNFCNFPPSRDDIPGELRRLPRWQQSVAAGPFYRFAPASKSRFSKLTGKSWPVMRPLFYGAAKTLYLAAPSQRPLYADWKAKTGAMELSLKNRGPAIKDQFGEAPNAADYIEAGLEEITYALKAGKPVSALFLIDGGPRHKIVQAILELEDMFAKFTPTIVLCDAWRAFYAPTLSARPQGVYWPGTNRTIKGGVVQDSLAADAPRHESGGILSGSELAKREVWYYCR